MLLYRIGLGHILERSSSWVHFCFYWVSFKLCFKLESGPCWQQLCAELCVAPQKLAPHVAPRYRHCKGPDSAERVAKLSSCRPLYFSEALRKRSPQSWHSNAWWCALNIDQEQLAHVQPDHSHKVACQHVMFVNMSCLTACCTVVVNGIVTRGLSIVHRADSTAIKLAGCHAAFNSWKAPPRVWVGTTT